MDSKRKLSQLTKLLKEVDCKDDQKAYGGIVYKHKLINEKIKTGKNGQKKNWEKSRTVVPTKKKKKKKKLLFLVSISISTL
jgi:hypothetical protein